MRGINCTALWIKALYKCTVALDKGAYMNISVHLPFMIHVYTALMMVLCSAHTGVIELYRKYNRYCNDVRVKLRILHAV